MNASVNSLHANATLKVSKTDTNGAVTLISRLRLGAAQQLLSIRFHNALLVSIISFAWSVAGQADPLGATVVSGQAQVTTFGATTLINQSSSKAIINWQEFSVTNGAAVQFNQPNSASITLNRVTGSGISNIEGAVRANGQVWLLNPNGVLFGNNARINVGGLLATTSEIVNQDFLDGRYSFSGGQNGILNNGTIQSASGGAVVLSAPTVINHGYIQATGGHVVLGGADTFTVDFNGDHLLSYAVGAGSAGGKVTNTGTISAPGGRILLTARAAAGVQDAVINNTGMIEATSVREENGEIVLEADGGTTVNSGTLDTSGHLQGETGGTVKLLGQQVAVTDGASIDVAGDAGGGTALVGGNLRGAGPESNAQITLVGKATINADAVRSGNGGKVAVYSTGTTRVSGKITARGGAVSGNGGTVETSGHMLGVASDAIIDTSAQHGAAGTWLLDPATVEIDDGSYSGGDISGSVIEAPDYFASLFFSSQFAQGQGGSGTLYLAFDTSYICACSINAALNAGTNVTIGAYNYAASDIWVTSPITKTSGESSSLTLLAGNSIYIGAPITSTSSPLTINLQADTFDQSVGAILIAADIKTAGGDINFGTGALVNGALSGGDVYVNSQLRSPDGGGSLTQRRIFLDTTSEHSGGNITLLGDLVIANPAGLTVNTFHTQASGSDGNISIYGSVNSGNAYSFVNDAVSWNDAYRNAQSGSGSRVGDTYLATPSTALANSVGAFVSGYQSSWIGAERLTTSSVTGDPSTAPDQNALANTWYWVSGPLGSAANPNSPTGHGTPFFEQNGTTSISDYGGMTINGGYANWAAYEPNNANGSNLSPAGVGEYVAHTYGSWVWNDLSPDAGLPYVVQTNLPASPLTVNTGSGFISVTSISGKPELGNTRPLQSLTVTAGDLYFSGDVSIATIEGAAFNMSGRLYSNGSEKTLLTISASDTSGLYGSSAPVSLPLRYTVAGGQTTSAPPAGVSAASQAWVVTPTNSSDVGSYTEQVYGASCAATCPYFLVYRYGTYRINPAPVTISGLSAVSRPYNGSDIVSITGMPVLNGLLNQDVGWVNGSPFGTVASPNVQWNGSSPLAQSVSLHGITFSLSSGNPSNYHLVLPNNLSAVISPASLTVTGLNPVASQVYNGSSMVSLSGMPVITGLIGNQTVSINNLGTAGLASGADAGIQNVTAYLVLGNGANGGLASNYSIAPFKVGSVTITPAQLIVSGLKPVASRSYDGTTSVALTGTPVLSGLVGDQTVLIANLGNAGEAGSPNAGSRDVTAYLVLANGQNGGLAKNYTVRPYDVGTTTIDPALLKVSGLSPVSSQTYNGSAVVALTGTPAFQGLVGDQTVTILNLATAGTAASSGVGIQSVKADIVLGNGSNGGLASNYIVPAFQAGTVTIIGVEPVIARQLSVIAAAASTAAQVPLSSTSNGEVGQPAQTSSTTGVSGPRFSAAVAPTIVQSAPAPMATGALLFNSPLASNSVEAPISSDAATGSLANSLGVESSPESGSTKGSEGESKEEREGEGANNGESASDIALVVAHPSAGGIVIPGLLNSQRPPVPLPINPALLPNFGNTTLWQ